LYPRGKKRGTVISGGGGGATLNRRREGMRRGDLGKRGGPSEVGLYQKLHFRKEPTGERGRGGDPGGPRRAVGSCAGRGRVSRKFL